jgi:DNA-directed RNA polymerase specialized sigma subunit
MDNVSKLDETEFGCALRECRSGDEAQRRRISEAYLPVALEIAEQRRSTLPNLELLDVVQKANAALWEAINRYRGATAADFSMFARRYISAALEKIRLEA